MTFFSFGFNHFSASVARLDELSLNDDTVRALYRAVTHVPEVEFVLLSTCNRTECYLYGSESDVEQVWNALADLTNVTWNPEETFLFRDEEAVIHVLQVTAGMRSVVLGDAQILSQMKDAYRIAVEEACVTTVMHRLMHTAFRAAKRIVHETDLTSGAASVASVAAAMANRHLNGLPQRDPFDIVLVGAGQMAQLALQALDKNVPCTVRIANRTLERGLRVAEKYAAEAIAWEDRYAAIAEADAVIVASGAPCPIVEAAHLAARPSQRPDTLIVDIAVPRNVEPGVGDTSGYKLLDMDSLQGWIDDATSRRRASLPAAETICDEVMADFVSWYFHHQALQPAIHTILDTFDSIRAQEIERHEHRFNAIDRLELERLTRSIMQKVLAVPVVRLKNAGPGTLDYVRGIKLLQSLFARSSCEEPGAASHESARADTTPHEQPSPESLYCLFDPEDQADMSSIHMGRVEIKLGTRGSALARWQAEHIADRLKAGNVGVDIQIISTRGDRVIDTPLAKIGGKGLFTKELDRAILNRRIDLAVHSLKDLPSTFQQGLRLAAITQRANPLDVFVAHPSFEGAFDALPQGATLATSSVRRTAFLKAWRPDLNIVPVRGNVDTRLAELAKSEWHGIILAAAGLTRLGLSDRIRSQIDPSIVLPAPGQGALGVVCAQDRDDVASLLKRLLHDAHAALAVRAERAFLHQLEGGCQVPVGALARCDEDGRWWLEGSVASVDGHSVVRDRIEVDPDAPEDAGIQLAKRLLRQGAEALLETARS